MSIRGNPFLALALAGAITLVLGLSPAMATATPPPPEGCVGCHENLYQLHDTGKWFCLCAQEMSCSCCHGGDPQATTAEAAHAGMVAIPLDEQPTTCVGCHSEDSDQRIAAFVARAGVRQFHPTVAANSTSALANPPPIAGSFATSAGLLEPWRLAVLSALALVMAGLVIMGYRCWKADCRSRQRPTSPGDKS
jgi:hypothetical protein